MPLSWNEIRHNAIRFSKDWKRATSESADKQTFWNEFFGVFGIPRKTVASFEVPVLKTSGNFGKIDLLWKGVLLVEHKSAGEDLDKAKTQAFDYIQAMASEGKHKDSPRYVIVSDFAHIVLYSLEEDTRLTFPLSDFHKQIHSFAFIPGYKQHKFEDQDPINIEATEMLGELHDALEFGGYTGHDLERFLVRVLFCLFAEDTGLFNREAFTLYIQNRTTEDGSDLGPRIAQLFAVLNTPVEKRQRNLDEELQQFPYVNGDLFGENLGFAEFNRDMRNALLACTHFDWSRISPAIFGSLFQSIMESKERRKIGAHYTTERDILKVIRSLFLDDLRTELDARKADRSTGRQRRLEEFHEKLCSLRFLDPACGCGNFLVITYREIRALELETLKELFGKQTEFSLADVNKLSQVDVDQFYGIEIGEWPARIAEVALWLMDHQMNLKVSEAFGQLYQRLPLKKSPHIHCANALRTDWKRVLGPEKCSYILGNPPFIGKQFQTTEQKLDMENICGQVQGSGVLDYVTLWYFKAAEYIKNTRIVVGFVSTNSISQGEQVSILWGELFGRYHLKIHFSHRTFPWQSEARGKAHVHVVIIGFADFDTTNKRIYDYNGETISATTAKNISPYLIEGNDVVVSSRSLPISNVPNIVFGNMPNDGGHLILTSEEKAELIKKEPAAKKFIRLFLGAQEFINGEQRWCLWLKDVSPTDLREMPEVLKRIEKVRDQRSNSSRSTTKELAKTPMLFGEIRQPSSPYLAIPKTSSERRAYIPMAILEPDVITNTELFMMEDATNLHFGILTSSMHMAWVRQVCGRLKSDYRYSAGLVYNNFPWPESISDKHRIAIENAVKLVLGIRGKYQSKGEILAALYDPLATPPDLLKAHEALDRAVDRCYRPEPFTSERQRVEFLFSLYEKLTAPLAAAATKSKPKSKRIKTGRSTPQSEADAAHFYVIKDEPPEYKTSSSS